MTFLECSAKDNTNVDKAFEGLAKKTLSLLDPEQRTYVVRRSFC
jgi:hypothetical protein